MLHRIILGLILMNGYLGAMNDLGVWDKYGNYLGPTVPPSPIFIPVPISVVQFFPVFVHMQMPNGSMEFPSMLPVVSDAAPAVLENNSHTIDKEREVGGVLTHDNADGIVDQYDDEVAAIANRMDEAQVSSHNSTVATLARASRNWSDETDDNEPITLPPGWKMYAIPTDQNPPNESHHAVVSLADSAEKMKEEVPSASTECVIQVKKKRHTRSVASRQQLNEPGEDLLDERLNVAMHAPKNMHSLLRLLKTKVHWLARECSLEQRARECIQLAQQIKINLDAVRPVSQHAVTFLGYADTCIHKMQKEKTYESKRGFACLAREFIAIAQKGTLGHDQKLRIQNQLSSIPDDSIIADVDIFINK